MYKTDPSSKNSYLNTTRTCHFDHIKANYPSEGASTLNLTALPMEVAAISYLASWLPSDPLWSPRLSKRGPRSSSSTSQNDTSKLSGTGGNQRHWQQGAQQIQRPNLDTNISYRSNKETKHLLPSGFCNLLVHNVKELEALLMCNKSYCAETAPNIYKKFSVMVERGPSKSPIPGHTEKKTHRRLVYTLYLC